MVDETSKAFMRRSSDRRFATRWLVGEGIDIGAGDDSLDAFRVYFPLITKVRSWDLGDGDAMLMASVPDESYDFVHSSHCLEHLNDPSQALANWIRICRPGGHLIIMIPDEDRYEQKVFPSTFNPDHKFSFTIHKSESWSTKSVNLFDLLKPFSHQVEVLKLEVLDSGYNYAAPRTDQTLNAFAEAAIEIILKKIDPSHQSRL